MKQRIYNTFLRIFKNKSLAVMLTNVGYKVLLLVYYIARVFFREESKLDVESARKILNETSPMPNMESVPKNHAPLKDLSIIVPAYNAEKTILSCIDSVIQQTTKYDYELIVVNDGSKDGTRAIIEKTDDLHIKLINQENRGFSGARNRGIDESVGKYIMFLDADDMLVGDCIEKMLDRIIEQDADIVQGSYYSFTDENNKWESILHDGVESDTESITRNPGFPWAKIYRREMFHQLRFPLDIWFEDTIVCMLLYRMCRKMAVMEDMVYAYRINPEGITKRARHSKKCVDHYWVMEYVLKKSHELGLKDDEIQYRLVRGHMSTLLYRRISLMEEQVKESAFILACEMLDEIRPKEFRQYEDNVIMRDIERAFKTRNYRLWKTASFVV